MLTYQCPSQPHQVFTALHVMQTRYSDENSVRPSVCQRQSCKVFTDLTNRAKIIGAGTPSTWNFGSKWPRWSEIADFRSLFARNDSAVTPSEKSSININRKSTTRFPMRQNEHSTLTLSPWRVARKRKVSEIWTISCDNFETVRDRVSATINH